MKEIKRDHGYAWVVLVASFFQTFLCACNTASIAVYLVDWTQYFNTTNVAISSAGSVFGAVSYFTGLLIGPLIDRLGCKVVSIIGAFVTAAGLIITSFATSVAWIYISFSLVCGVGTGMVLLPSMIVVQYYFDKKRAFASGISQTGFGLGAFVMVPVLRFLSETYGWRGAILIQAAMLANVIVTGSLYRTPHLMELSKHKENTKHENLANKSLGTRCCNSVLDFLKTKWDIKLFKRLIFVLLIIGTTAGQLSVEIMFKFTTLKAAASGIDKVKTSIFPSIVGIFSTIGRLATSILANFKCVNRTVLFGLAILLSGLGTIGCGFTIDIVSLAIVCGLYGLTLGAFMTLTTTVLVDLVGLSSLVQGQSFITGGMGLAVTVSLTLAGYIADETNNYNIPYHIYGSITAVGGISVLIIPFVQRLQEKKKEYKDIDIHHNDITTTDNQATDSDKCKQPGCAYSSIESGT